MSENEKDSVPVAKLNTLPETVGIEKCFYNIKAVHQNKSDDSDLWVEIDELREKRADLRKQLEILRTLRNEICGVGDSE